MLAIELQRFFNTYNVSHLIISFLFLALSIYFFIKSNRSTASKFILSGCSLFVLIALLELYAFLRGEFFYFLRDYVSRILIIIGGIIFIKNRNNDKTSKEPQ